MGNIGLPSTAKLHLQCYGKTMNCGACGGQHSPPSQLLHWEPTSLIVGGRKITTDAGPSMRFEEHRKEAKAFLAG
jgi:hypothetical protein